MSENKSNDVNIIYRSVLWREVVRSYSKKDNGLRDFRRAHVNLPREVVDALNISKDDDVAFIMRDDSKYVTLTKRSFDINPLEKDPQGLLEKLLAQVLLLKYKKEELLQKLDKEEIEPHHFTTQRKEIRDKLDLLTENLSRVDSTHFRGTGDHLNMMLTAKTQFDLNLYANSIFDYLEDLIQNIRSNKIVINGVELAYSKGLIEESEYNQEKKELELKQKQLSEILEQSRKILTQTI